MESYPINEKHQWTADGPNIMSDQKLEEIEHLLNMHGGSIIVEHRVYCGGGGCYKMVFDDIEEFTAYLESKAKPGDNILVWSYYELCTDDKILAHGKYPDAKGRVPLGGAY